MLRMWREVQRDYVYGATLFERLPPGSTYVREIVRVYDVSTYGIQAVPLFSNCLFAFPLRPLKLLPHLETIPKRRFDKLSTNGNFGSARTGLFRDERDSYKTNGTYTRSFALSLSKGSAQRVRDFYKIVRPRIKHGAGSELVEGQRSMGNGISWTPLRRLVQVVGNCSELMRREARRR